MVEGFIPPDFPPSPPWSPCEAVVSNDLWFVGVFLDAIATLAGTGGKQLLRYAVVTKNPWYYPLGLVCTAMIDPAFDISAYGFAAQSIIAPMAGMVVVWNVLIAPCTLGEQLTRSRLRGAMLIVVGTLCVGLFGNHNEHHRTVTEYLELFAHWRALLYYLAFTAFSAVCGYYWRYGTPFVAGFSCGALGGGLAGNMFTTKAVVEMVKCVATSDESDPCAAAACTFNPFYTVYPYLFVTVSLTLACVSLYLLAVGLRTFEALYMITVFEGFMILSGSISGNLVMYEMEGQPGHLLALYACAIGLILIGLYVLLNGERASAKGRLLTNNNNPAADAESQELAPSTRSHCRLHYAPPTHHPHLLLRSSTQAEMQPATDNNDMSPATHDSCKVRMRMHTKHACEITQLRGQNVMALMLLNASERSLRQDSISVPSCFRFNICHRCPVATIGTTSSPVEMARLTPGYQCHRGRWVGCASDRPSLGASMWPQVHFLPLSTKLQSGCALTGLSHGLEGQGFGFFLGPLWSHCYTNVRGSHARGTL